MRLAPLVGLLLMAAGCVQPDAAVPTSSSPTSALQEPAVDSNAIVEIAGSNITWDGRGVVEWDVVVPANTSSLAFAWWQDETAATAGSEVAAMLTMDGCPDDPHAMSYGGGVGHRWCENPEPGPHHATYTLHAGILHGRVCILAIPEGNNSLDDCAFSPFN